MKKTLQCTAMAALFLAGSIAWAKLPPPPPMDAAQKAVADQKAEEKKTKDAATAAQAKADAAAAEEATIRNYQANMKKAGKPIPKPTPVIAAAPAAQPMPGPGAAKGTPTPGDKAGATGAVDAKGHEKGAMTPAGNTPPKGTDTPTDAKKK
jgi:hypothetical protein